jgi:hypothetical protein
METVLKRTRDMKVGDIILYYRTPTVITNKVETSPNRYTIWLSYISTKDGTIIQLPLYFTGDSQTDVIIV